MIVNSETIGKEKRGRTGRETCVISRWIGALASFLSPTPYTYCGCSCSCYIFGFREETQPMLFLSAELSYLSF
ncbi:hypothetical protein AX774_g5176 [Zancudomyces culisetae]|uniref:Uncharacterized protein n=1 Tax=Zancudomyces culisetae TaxID=1213189 RepID=A0A1R1PK89_ZANCU|nr:hypothetical protein AX774_g5176 [Zancudomyces culisetae]|eukprot:OMH81374.1 hypothetical protein AX774_g5176 [Zancudomyces culisetae]